MNTKEFHISTGKELLAVKDRVRHLISHWGEDGRYKESVLKLIIKRFLPEKYKIATGFVVKETHERGNHNASSQIDLIIYDNQYPVLFKDNDFVIVTPDSVRAIIEVKANIKNQDVKRVVEKSNDVGKFIYNGKTDKNSFFFNGVFSYAGYERIQDYQIIENKITFANLNCSSEQYFNKFKVNHICFNSDLLFKFWEQKTPNESHYLYKLKDLSFSFFISNLMDYLGGDSVILNSNLWYPIDKSIEVVHKFK